MIALKHIYKKFKDKDIFSDANLLITKCGVYLVSGPSGCGKTTLLNIIGNLILYKGNVVNEHLDNMGYVSQNSQLINHLSVRENLDLFKIEYSVLNKYKMSDLLDVSIESLSRGERSRIAFIIAIYSDSELVLIDEPITNLDSDNARLVIEDIFNFKDEKIIIVVSHEDKEFIDKVDGIIKIKNKKIVFKNKSKRQLIKNKNKRKIRIDKNYVMKEFLFHKKDNIKIYLSIFFTVMFIFLCSLVKNILFSCISKDIENSLDYNKYYLSECKEESYDGLTLKKCGNVGKDKLELLEKDSVFYGFNYDYLLNSLYSRDDFYVFYGDIKLKEGRYPGEFKEVVASDNYKLGDTIEVEANLIVNDRKNDVYSKVEHFRVVGIYNDLLFMEENSIYFDYEFSDKYYKNELLINNGYSLYDYYNKLEIPNYKYLAFLDDEIEYLDLEGSKKEFYNNLIELIDSCYELITYLEMFLFIYALYLIYRFNKNKLMIKQKNNAFLIANSFPVFNSVFVSCVSDVVIDSAIFIVLSVVGLVLKMNINLLALLYTLIITTTLLQTYFFYRKKNVARLIREEVW